MCGPVCLNSPCRDSWAVGACMVGVVVTACRFTVIEIEVALSVATVQSRLLALH